ncbi:hypothetical protein ACEPAG_7823 [Sanghuangporus baumii]
MQPAFYKVPPEIWENVIAHVGRRDLAALALATKETYPVANRLLYSTLELSFCKCSESYYDFLARTFTDHPELAALVTHLFIDMKVPCRVKSTTSFDDLHPIRSRFRPYALLWGMANHERFSSPKGQADWNGEALRTLSNAIVYDILPHLYNVEKITVILGLFQQSPEILDSLCKALPVGVLPSLQFLKVYDATLESPPLRSTSALRVLDLGYVNVDGSELCTLVSQNAETLEEIQLRWIIEPTQTPLFSDYSGSAVKNLKIFASQGPLHHSSSGLQRLLGEASMLEELHLESQSMISAAVWGHVFSNLTSKGNWTAQQMHVVKLGASAGCSEFWDAVVKFLCRCGDGLNSLYINGSSKGSIGPFPSGLLSYFANHSQPKLSSLVLIWRDDDGFSPESAITLASFAPNLELFHVSLPFPPDLVNKLLGMMSPFPKLRRAHFTFLKSAWPDTDQHYPNVYDEMAGQIDRKGPVFREFLRRAADQHSLLTEASWSVYDRRAYSSVGPKAYVKVSRR